ncbi:unnamed protein product [Schistocephalus solidus]|uniref:Reverse transcriptase domain-containing protein n=1 Tax=Schistocephalus solidus TaxID=70667 RepID=A0A183THV5_SCHSO|nr:unnamed protein product [Schistocephalus solidus]
MVNAPVAAYNRHPTLTCDSSYLGSSQGPHIRQPSRQADITSDFNTRVGTAYASWQGVLGNLEQGLLCKSQCGFQRHRGTTDMIFTAPQLQEKCQEIRTHLYTTFVDLTKTFDTVNRDGLWNVMHKFGCPERFTHMMRQLHDGMTARVTDNGTVSEALTVNNLVKQGCVLAPTLFSLMFSAMLMDAYRDEQPGIRIAYRTDFHLLNSRRMQAPTRVYDCSP